MRISIGIMGGRESGFFEWGIVGWPDELGAYIVGGI